MKPKWQIELMGGLRIRCGSSSLTHLKTQKTEELLAYLALNKGEMISREWIAGVIWNHSGAVAEAQNLRKALSFIRQALKGLATQEGVNAPSLRTLQQSLQILPEDFSVDVADFYEHLDLAQKKSDPVWQIEHLQKAVQLYQGPILPQSYLNEIILHRYRCENDCLSAFNQLVSLQQQQGQIEAALRSAKRIVEIDPSYEQGYLHQISLLTELGYASEALRIYEQMKLYFQVSLNTEPSDQAKSLIASIKNLASSKPPPRESNPPLTPPSVPPPSQTGVGMSLPVYFTRFVGRERYLLDLKESLDSSALVTLTGFGGYGKTRLAVEFAHTFKSEFPGGVWFVSMADLTQAEQIIPAIARAMRLPTHSPDVSSIAEALAESQTLLILDNMEHLIPAGTQIVRQLRNRVPSLKCLVTSRRRLDISGECTLQVEALATPEQKESPARMLVYPAVALFVDRARAKKPTFHLTEKNAEAVRLLCHVLEGTPLAIELAAARSPAMTPQDILKGILESKKRFAILMSATSHEKERHSSLWACIEWSYRLLPEELKHLFLRLSVFHGGWDYSALEAICGETNAVDSLHRLCGFSLIKDLDAFNIPRFTFLETIREFADAHLEAKEKSDLKQRHYGYFEELLLSSAGENLENIGKRDWLDAMELEIPNLQSAVGWALENGSESRLLALPPLWCLLTTRGYISAEASRLRKYWEKHKEALGAVRPYLLLRLAACYIGEYPFASDCLKEALTLFQNQANGEQYVVSALSYLAYDALTRHDYDAAFGYSSAHLEATQACLPNSQRSQAFACRGMGLAKVGMGEMAEAQEYFRRSLSCINETNDFRAKILILDALAEQERLAGAYANAVSWHEQAVEVALATQDRTLLADALLGYSDSAIKWGDWATASRLLQEQLVIRHEIGDIGMVEGVLARIAQVLLVEEDGNVLERGIRAARLLGAAETMRYKAFPRRRDNYTDPHQATKDRVCALLTEIDPAAFNLAFTAGQQMSVNEAIACAMPSE